MTRKILKGILISNIILVITSLLSFINAKYFILNIGLQSYGIIKVFTQLLGYITLAESGTGTASTYALYKPLAEGDYQRVNEVLHTMKKLYTRIIFFIILSGALLVLALPFILKDVNVDFKIVLYWSIYVLNSALSYVGAKYAILYTADQKYNLVKAIQGSSQIISQSLQLISLFVFKSLLLFIMLHIVGAVLSIMGLKRYFDRDYRAILAAKKQVLKIDKAIVKGIKDLFFHKLSYVLIGNTDLIIISTFISVETAAIYFSYSMISKMLTTLVETITAVITPSIGKFISFNDKNAVYTKFKSLNIFYLYSALVFSVTTYLLIQPFMTIWINNKFDNQLLIFFLCLNMGIAIYRSCLDVFKHGSGFFSDIHLPILEAGINLVLSLLLVTRFGLVGIVVGTTTSNVLIGLIYKPISTYRECFNKPVSAYLKDYLMYLVYTVVIVGIAHLVNANLNVSINNFLGFFVKGFIVFMAVVATVFILMLIDRNFLNSLKHFLSSEK